MKKLMIAMTALAAMAQTLAMPTRAELSKAQPLVNELMAPALEEYKSAADKTAAAVKVGDSSCAFAAEAETEAAKFLLLKGAVSYYVRGEAYDKAADCIATMQSDIKNLTPDVVAEIVGKATGRISEAKAPRLIAYYRAAKLQVRARKELPVIEKKLKRAKTEQLQRQYAEALAISGNWKAAYDAFAKVRDKNLAQIAEAEAKGTAANEQAAELWWNYTPEFEGAGDFFKVHAVEFYQKALDNGEISGLKKTVVERRIAQIGKETAAPSVAKTSDASRGGDAAGQSKTKTIDLGGGVKMEMIYVAPGSFMMGSDNGEKTRPVHKVILTKGFWLGKYEVTQKQWKQVMGNGPSKFKGDDRPVEQISWDDCQEFIRKVNGKLGGERVRLPTEAEWEYACRAGNGGDFGGTGRIDDMGWYKANSGDTTHPVGQKQANAWGFHDMHGNVFEWCLDGFDAYTKGIVTDPVGQSSKKVLRGGCRYLDEKDCSSGFRIAQTASYSGGGVGFRLCMSVASMEEVAERQPTKVVAQTSVPAANGERPKDMSLTLPGGVVMDFAGCPAGSFMIGKPGDSNSKSATFEHKVTITRPFWIGKYQVTWRQWKVFYEEQFGDTVAALGGLDAAKGSVQYNMAMSFCEAMTKKFKREIPHGYVCRLPTEAEWEYALRANCTDPSDPYVNRSEYNVIGVSKDDKMAMIKKFGLAAKQIPQILPPAKVGMKKPNAWGIYDMVGNGPEVILDTCQIRNSQRNKGRNEYNDLTGAFPYRENEIDPLYLVQGNVSSLYSCHVWGGLKRAAEIGSPVGENITFRLVVGPDLVAEKMAKNGKK